MTSIVTTDSHIFSVLMVLAWKAALATSLVNDGVAFEIRHRGESTIVIRLKSFLQPFAKTMSLSREVEQRWSTLSHVSSLPH
jgi:hypothetical protein